MRLLDLGELQLICMMNEFVVYSLSGYAVYGWRRFKGEPTSMISTSTDEPDEAGLHK